MTRANRKDGFKMVGPNCMPFENNISIDEAEDLHDVVMFDFFGKLPVKTPRLSEVADKSMCARAFHNQPYEDTASPSVFVGAMLHHMNQHTWRMNIMHTKLSRARHNNAQQRIETRMNVEVYDHQLVEAVRKMRVIRGVGELTVDAVERQMEEDTEEGYVIMQRRAYERHMTSDDCERAKDALYRTIKRAQASRR